MISCSCECEFAEFAEFKRAMIRLELELESSVERVLAILLGKFESNEMDLSEGRDLGSGSDAGSGAGSGAGIGIGTDIGTDAGSGSGAGLSSAELIFKSVFSST